MKVLVTGAAGFTGTWLMQFLSQQEGVERTGLVRKLHQKNTLSSESCIVADLLERNHLFTAVAKVCPDALIHLAGLTQGTLGDLLQANVTGTKNILDAGYAANPDCRMLVVSSSAAYGYQGTLPIDENTPFLPLSEYGMSKAAQDILTMMHHRTTGSSVTVARPFNLIGPGQDVTFLCGKIVRQIVECEQGKRDTLDLRETQSRRDFVDVRDVVKAYWALISHAQFTKDCAGKAFNIGSGQAYSVSDIISALEQITGMHYPVHLPAVPPPVFIPAQQSDNSQVSRTTGWIRTIRLHDSLKDMLDAARESVRHD